jgi:hypothetical protein
MCMTVTLGWSPVRVAVIRRIPARDHMLFWIEPGRLAAFCAIGKAEPVAQIFKVDCVHVLGRIRNRHDFV